MKFTRRNSHLVKVGIRYTGHGLEFVCLWCSTHWKAHRGPFGGFEPRWSQCPLQCLQRCPESTEVPAAYRAQRWPEGVPVQPAYMLGGYEYPQPLSHERFGSDSTSQRAS